MAHNLTIDPLSGVRTDFIDHADNEFKIVSSMDAQPVLDNVKRLKDHQQSTVGHGFRLAGSVPMTIVHQWAIESNTRPFSKEWHEYAKKKLNSNEFRNLRVWEGQL